MKNEGTHDKITRFALHHDGGGIAVFQTPVVQSNQQFLEVVIHGSPAVGNVFEVDSTPVPFSVEYTCTTLQGHAEVTLTLKKATVGDHEPDDVLTLSWRKDCGIVPYTSLNVFIRSDAYNNKTAAVVKGKTLQGFERPCNVGSSGSCGVGRVAAPLLLEIPPKDLRTTLELAVDQDGDADLSSFPDVSFQAKVLMVTLIYSPRSQPRGKQRAQLRSPYGNSGKAAAMGKKTSKKATQETVSVKYTCFKDGVSPVIVTLHVADHKSVEIAWNKRCKEPKAKQGKSVLTAPQALAFAMLCLGGLGLALFAVCFCCGQEDRQNYKYEGINGHDGGRARDVELSQRGGRRSIEPEVAPIGASTRDEVTYH